MKKTVALNNDGLCISHLTGGLWYDVSWWLTNSSYRNASRLRPSQRWRRLDDCQLPSPIILIKNSFNLFEFKWSGVLQIFSVHLWIWCSSTLGYSGWPYFTECVLQVMTLSSVLMTTCRNQGNALTNREINKTLPLSWVFIFREELTDCLLLMRVSAPRG